MSKFMKDTIKQCSRCNDKYLSYWFEDNSDVCEFCVEDLPGHPFKVKNNKIKGK